MPRTALDARSIISFRISSWRITLDNVSKVSWSSAQPSALPRKENPARSDFAPQIGEET
jgi:hypothetical protein